MSLLADTAAVKTYIVSGVETDKKAAISIRDDDAPIISIVVHEDSKPSVTEAPDAKAKFTISSNSAVHEDITVEIGVIAPLGILSTCYWDSYQQSAHNWVNVN